MKVQTKKLTTAAVCTALAVMLCAMTAYLPLSFMPLFLAAFCIFLACKRGSFVYGVLCAAASVGLMFLMSGLSVKWLAFILIFAPYGLLCSVTDRFTYLKPKTAVLRGLTAVAFFNLTVGIVYVIATNVLTVGLDINIADWVSKVGGYAVFAVIATVVLVPLDFIFCTLSAVVLKRVPARLDKAEALKRKKEQADKGGNAEDRQVDNAPQYDIFGYEIKSGQAERDNDESKDK